MCAYNLRKNGAQLIAQQRLDVQQEYLAKKSGINRQNIRIGSSAGVRHVVMCYFAVNVGLKWPPRKILAKIR